MMLVNLRAIGGAHAPEDESEEPMSIVRCDRCSGQIDTDKDTECEVYVGNYKRLHATKMLCEACRCEREAEHDYQDALAALAEHQAERNAQ